MTTNTGKSSRIAKALAILLITLCSHIALGQFELSGNFRPRFEFRDGYQTLSDPSDKSVALVTQRTRLNARFIGKSGIQSYISFQDLRTWGEFDTNSFESATSLYEGWIQFPVLNQFALRLGRQEIEYDDSRMISSNGWRLQARSHDAAMLIYHSPDSSLQVNVTGAINNEGQVLSRDVYRANHYKNMFMIWANKKIKDSEISLLYLDNGFQLADTSINHFKTVGVYIKQGMGGFTVTGSYYSQFGRDGQNRDVSSSFLSLTLSAPIGDKFTVSPGFDMLSGTSAGDLLNPAFNGTSTFIPLFARRHRHFGEHDFFYAGGFDIVPGLTDIFIKTSYKFSESVSAKLNGHYFQTAKKFLDESGGIVDDKYLGIEFDAGLDYKYSDDLKFKFGYTHFLPTTSLEILKGGDSDEIAQFGYVQITYSPTFLEK
ncbi:MAG: alginate export family protein [Bacteroidota bacterium]